VVNLGLLAFFKYFNFFIDSIDTVVAQSGIEWAAPMLKVTLPVGISFYTFQTMSYTIDVYRGDIAPERSLLRVALFVAYFPQLVAGPIIRPQHFLPALERSWEITGASMRAGMNLAMVGLFKKVLIADNVAPLVDTIFGFPEGQSSIVVMLGTALFAIQIYCDFSGYTDIARGISRMFGVEIPLNFNFPYFSTSIIDFWRRWHISLSSWLRDYLYIPLGGSRGSGFSTYANLMITMALGGLWHGASWNFVIWGVYQGALLCINRVFRAIVPSESVIEKLLESKIGTIVRWGVTMYFWMLGWLIFRVTDFSDLYYCAKKYVLFDANLSLGGVGIGRGDPFTAMLAAALFAMLHLGSFFSKRWDERLNSMHWALRALMYIVITMLFFYGWPSQSAAFIYFQF
jgi:D-alanyl-lipoteichoic acid acyltransferase DltB (MBOAT superfamily)